MKSTFSARKSLVIFLSGWFTYALNAVSMLLVARLMGPAVVGRIGYAAGLAGVLVMFTNLGITFAHTKRMAEGYNPALAIGTCTILIAALHLLSLPLLGLLLLKGQYLFDTGADQELFIVLLGSQVLSNFATIAISTLYALGFASRASFGQVFGKVVRLFAIVTVLVWHRGIVSIGLAFFLDSAITCFALFAAMYPCGFQWPTRDSIASYWRYAKPMIGISSAGMFIDSIDRVILKSTVGVVSLGYYNVARSILEAAKSIPSSAVSLLFPKWTQDFAAHSSKDVVAKFYDSLNKLLLISGAVSLVIAVAAPDIVRLLFGAAFEPATSMVRILAWGTLASSLLGTFHYTLYASEKHHIILVSQLLMGVVYILSLLGFTKLWGADGAAGALYLTWLVPAFWINREAFRTLGICLQWKHLFYVFAAFLAFGLAWPLHRLRSWYTLFPSVLLALSVYGSFLLYTGQFSREHSKYWLDLLNFKKLWHEIRGEFRKTGSSSQ